MTSLNAGFENEDEVNTTDVLPEDFNNPTVTETKSSDNQPEAPANTFMAINGAVTERNDNDSIPTIAELFGEEVIPNEIPNVNTDFIFIQQNTNVLRDISVLNKDIAKACSISQEEIEVLNSLVPGYINDDNPIGLYTKVPTKTGYNRTINDINVHLDQQFTIQLNTCKEALKAMQIVLDEGRIYVTGSFIERLKFRQTTANNLLDSFNHTSVYKIKDLVNCSIEKLTSNENTNISTAAQALLEMINTNHRLNALISNWLVTSDVSDLDTKVTDFSDTVNVSIKDILTLIASPNQINFIASIDEFFNRIKQVLDFIENILKSLTTSDTNLDMIVKCISEMKANADDINGSINFIRTINLFNKTAIEISEYLVGILQTTPA